MSPSPSRSRALATVLARRRVPIALAVVGLVGHQIAEALVPVLIGVSIDRAIAPGDPVMLALCLVALCALFTVLLLAWRFGELNSVRAAEEGARAVRGALVSRVLSPVGFARPRSPGELLSIAGSDADRAAGIVWLLTGTAAELAAVLTAAVSLLVISMPLGVLVLLSTPALVALLHVVTAPLERRMDAEQEAAATAAATAADLLTGLRTVAGLHAEDAAARRFAAANERSLRASRRAVSAKAAYTMASMGLSALLLAGIAAAAAGQALAGSISIGELVTVLGLAQFLYGPVGGLAFVGAELATVRASAKRVDAVLAAPTARPAGASGSHGGAGAAGGAGTPGSHGDAGAAGARAAGAPGGAGTSGGTGGTGSPGGAGAAGARAADVVFDGLATANAGPFSARIPAGGIVTLQVADPRGARELCEVLAGARLPERGRIVVGGHELTGILDAPLVLAPPHQPAIFSGTLRENIELHAPLDDADLERVADAAALDDVREAARGDWDLPVGERGLTLSGGQRQRVALARSLAREADVLVLHDPTSAVDSVTESAIAERLAAARGGRTTILVASSPALVRICDTVVEVPAARGAERVDA
ncbi:ABC transporter transmembrane domain-containing protein [Microbacterium sp.]|uniref:ABC transporter transmembrane domain-containing protein n=1 Tax=Microbacterium sp. TaxID=51671 RepID=UPI0039E5B3AC